MHALVDSPRPAVSSRRGVQGRSSESDNTVPNARARLPWRCLGARIEQNGEVAPYTNWVPKRAWP